MGLQNISQYRDGTFYYDGFVRSTRTWFLTAVWFQKYDFIEFLCSIDQIGYSFSDHINNALEHEMSGYRIIDGSVAQITSKEEISAIEDAIDDSDRWRPVSNHLRTALIHLSSRENPDYRNSIKESISAVEALCCIITENKEATLGQALKEIEKSHRLHAALKKSFSHLCGYASNADGIRHALLEDSIELRFEDAKFMLVSCSTFVNYLKSKITMK